MVLLARQPRPGLYMNFEELQFEESGDIRKQPGKSIYRNC